MTKRCSFSVYITGKCQICCYHTGVRFVLSCTKMTYTNSNPQNRKSITFPCVLWLLLLLNVSFFCLLGLNLVRRNCALLCNVQTPNKLRNSFVIWKNKATFCIKNLKFNHFTEVRFASFLSGGFITAIVVNPPERKLAKHTSVHCCREKSRDSWANN